MFIRPLPSMFHANRHKRTKKGRPVTKRTFCVHPLFGLHHNSAATQ